MDAMRSDVTAISWPALVNDRGARLAATLLQLEHSQWWPAERLIAAQHRQLAVLLKHALQTVPFYRQRFPDPGVKFGTSVFVDMWQSLPLLNRGDIQAAGTQLYSTACPAAHGKIMKAQTSGSTGQPVELLSTAITRHFWQVLTLREHLWHQRNFKARLVSIRPDRDSAQTAKEMPSWGAPAALLFNTGPSALLHSSVSIDRQVQWLVEQQPGYLLSMPSNLQALAEAMSLKRIELPSLLCVRSYGETLQPEVRSLLEAQWGVPVVDMYSSVEIGYLALQCPLHDHYHLQSETILTEVLDEAGQPCTPGQIGKLVVTPLHNFASPVFRYDIGDYVEVGEPCSCGRGLPVIKRIMGRERNLITLPDGSRHWPSFPEHDWMGIAPIRQLQLAQTSLEDIEIRMVCDDKLSPQQIHDLGEIFSQALGHSFNYTCTYHDSLLRGRNLKFEDFVSELGINKP